MLQVQCLVRFGAKVEINCLLFAAAPLLQRGWSEGQVGSHPVTTPTLQTTVLMTVGRPHQGVDTSDTSVEAQQAEVQTVHVHV